MKKRRLARLSKADAIVKGAGSVLSISGSLATGRSSSAKDTMRIAQYYKAVGADLYIALKEEECKDQERHVKEPQQ